MRFRITIRGEGVELRGYADGESAVLALASALAPERVVLASHAEDDYNPFAEERQRELHHFETEQKNAELLALAERLEKRQQALEWGLQELRKKAGIDG